MLREADSLWELALLECLHDVHYGALGHSLVLRNGAVGQTLQVKVDNV